MDENQIEQKPPVAPVGQPPENELAEWKRKAEEAERRVEMARRENDMLREQRLREMASTPAPQSVPEESEEELNNEFTSSPMRAVNKMIEKKAAELDKVIERRARQIYIQEAKKIEAVTKFPALRDPNSDFFKKVAYYMDTHPEKYNDSEGLMDACARVSVDLGIVPQRPEVLKANENVRLSVSSAASQVAGAGNAPVGESVELDAKALELAAKLGIDPKDYAARLKNYQEGKGEYAPASGKTGKATLNR